MNIAASVKVAEQELRDPLILRIAGRRAPDQEGLAYHAKPLLVTSLSGDTIQVQAQPGGPGRTQTPRLVSQTRNQTPEIAGEDCSQPPAGFADAMLPA